MNKDWNEKECIGQCPKCDSYNLEYGASEGLDDSRIYPFICLDCGQEGREVYIEKYACTETEAIAEQE